MLNVLKSTGEKEEFNEEKLRSSIKRARIPDELQDHAINYVKSKIYDGIPTSEIYKYVLESLGRSSHPYSRAKYGLRQAIADFGPTGYPFEDFVAEIFKLQGYSTEVRVVLSGKCISHEIDIVAQKDSKKYMTECKFHNNNGTKTDCHVSMYTKARFDDLKFKNNLDQAWLVTNTKVTQDALSYALCENVKIISWDYPENESLRDLIERLRLHPITILTTLSQNQKQMLLENHIVHCKKLCENPAIINVLNLPREKADEVISEAEYICSL